MSCWRGRRRRGTKGTWKHPARNPNLRLLGENKTSATSTVNPPAIQVEDDEDDDLFNTSCRFCDGEDEFGSICTSQSTTTSSVLIARILPMGIAIMRRCFMIDISRVECSRAKMTRILMISSMVFVIFRRIPI